jgi:CheY-like chemotaxis protein
MDVAMPEMTDVLHELKTSNPTRGIPVIAVGAYTMLTVGVTRGRRQRGLHEVRRPSVKSLNTLLLIAILDALLG